MVKVQRILHLFFFFFSRGIRTARIASSNTIFNPCWVRAEHSKYFCAPIFLANVSPWKRQELWAKLSQNQSKLIVNNEPVEMEKHTQRPQENEFFNLACQHLKHVSFGTLWLWWSIGILCRPAHHHHTQPSWTLCGSVPVQGLGSWSPVPFLVKWALLSMWYALSTTLTRSIP